MFYTLFNVISNFSSIFEKYRTQCIDQWSMKRTDVCLYFCEELFIQTPPSYFQLLLNHINVNYVVLYLRTQPYFTISKISLATTPNSYTCFSEQKTKENEKLCALLTTKLQNYVHPLYSANMVQFSVYFGQKL